MINRIIGKLVESDNALVDRKRVNIREALNRIDCEHYTDFLNLYECAELSLDKKKALAQELVKEEVDLKVIESFFDDYEDDEEEGKCPNCGEIVEYATGNDHLIMVDTETAYYNCKCPKCGKSFKEWHDIQLNFSHYEEISLEESLDNNVNDTLYNRLKSVLPAEHIDNHETDLYVVVCPESTRLLKD